MAGEITDYTSSFYALVVLATATIGLSSYIRNHYSSDFKEHQARFKKEWSSRQKKNHGFNFSDEAKEGIDKIDNQRPTEILLPFAVLASVLPYAAVGQTVMVVHKAWGEVDTFTWLMPVTLIFWYLICLFATIAIMRNLIKLRKSTEEIKDNVDSILKIVDAECRGGKNNITSPLEQVGLK